MPPELPLDRSPKSSKFSLLDTAFYSQEHIKDLFSIGERFEKETRFPGYFQRPRHRTIACLFFEPSTRTRLSFQMAANRLGYQVLNFDGASSSLSKGETLYDTVLNIAAMNPDAIVIRYGQDGAKEHLAERMATFPLPVISAGIETTSHPTQALLDAFTIYREFGTLIGRKVLIVGDIVHSRVARSNFDVLQKMGAEVAVCGPPAFLPLKGMMPSYVKSFASVDEGIEWCDVYMALRIQHERHETGDARATDEFLQNFSFTAARANRLRASALILHPGPINHGVEFHDDAKIMADPRTRILQQVSNGVLIRAALLEQIFRDSKESA